MARTASPTGSGTLPTRRSKRVAECDPGNLFVPFLTTKANGTGIGLVLSRQIAEAHGGTVVLEPRPKARSACARLRLPLGPLMSTADS